MLAKTKAKFSGSMVAEPPLKPEGGVGSSFSAFYKGDLFAFLCTLLFDFAFLDFDGEGEEGKLVLLWVFFYKFLETEGFL